jgi:mRNA-degrading endonuclease RelE of RelBE toxin-antitoxin system
VSPRHRGKGRRYRIDYAESSLAHLQRLTARDRATVVDAIDERLSFEPTVETRNRKRMNENSLEADFELRVGEIRVYYVVDEAARVLSVLAVARKKGNRVIIGGEEIEL